MVSVLDSVEQATVVKVQNWSKFELDAVDGQKAIGDALKWISSGGSARRLVEVFKNFVDLCIELIAPTDVQRDQQHYPLIYFIGVLSINRKGDYKLVNNVTTSMAGLIWVARALFLHYYLPADGDYVGILQANSESNSDQETGIASSLQASASTSSPVSVSAIFDNDNTVPGEVRPDLDPEDEVDEAIYGELADLGQDTSSDQKRSDAYLVAERRFLAKQQEFLTSYLGK